MTIEIVQSTHEHVRMLSQVMCEQDMREVEALGLSPQKALWRSYKGSICRETAFVNGQIAAMWGVSGNPMGLQGAPWLLTSNVSKTVSPVAFAFIYRRSVRGMLELFPTLENWVDASYTEAVRLLQIIGFELGEPEPLGPKGALFRKYIMRA